jgi:DNA gyrase/topoisomerase IV subunit A
MERFDFTHVQANEILAMRLRRLTGLEREELENEYKELLQQIEMYRQILSGRRAILNEVQKEIERVKRGLRRRTPRTAIWTKAASLRSRTSSPTRTWW